MGRTNRIGLALAGLVVVLAMFSAGSRLISVHQQTSDWALWPKAVPSKVQFAGRDYHCGRNPNLSGAAESGSGGTVGQTGSTLQGLAIRGKTAGGADIYASAAAVPESIRVLTAGGVYSCALMGGS